MTLARRRGSYGRGDRAGLPSGLALRAHPRQGLPALPLRRSDRARARRRRLHRRERRRRRAARRSNGGVSSIGPFDANWEYTLDRAHLTTAMNPGLGGGPLLDTCGQRRRRRVARPERDRPLLARRSRSTTSSTHRDELLRYGARPQPPTRAWLGFYCYMLRDHVVIAGVLPGTPGERRASRRRRRARGRRAATSRAGASSTELPLDASSRASRRRCRSSATTASTTVTVASGDVEEFFA